MMPGYIVLKSGPARRVDPGLGRPGPGTGPDRDKNPPGNWPGETQSTRDPVGDCEREETRGDYGFESFNVKGY